MEGLGIPWHTQIQKPDLAGMLQDWVSPTRFLDFVFSGDFQANSTQLHMVQVFVLPSMIIFQFHIVSHKVLIIRH